MIANSLSLNILLQATGASGAASADIPATDQTASAGTSDTLSSFMALLAGAVEGKTDTSLNQAATPAKADGATSAKTAASPALALLAQLSPQLFAQNFSVGGQGKSEGSSTDTTSDGRKKEASGKDRDTANMGDINSLLALLAKFVGSTQKPTTASGGSTLPSPGVAKTTGKTGATAPQTNGDPTKPQPAQDPEMAKIFAKLGEMMVVDGDGGVKPNEAPDQHQLAPITALLAKLASQQPVAQSATLPSAAISVASRAQGAAALINATEALATTSKKAVVAAGSTDATAALLGNAANAAPQATAPDGSVTSTANPGDVAEQRQLDLAKDSQWLDSLTREITQAAGHAKELKFQLNPEHLGSLRVELSNHANGTSVRLIATSESARTILADAQPRLVAEARAQGLRISEAHVDLGGGSGGSGQRQPGPETMIVRTQAAQAVAVDTSVPGGSGERYA